MTEDEELVLESVENDYPGLVREALTGIFVFIILFTFSQNLFCFS